MTDLDHMPPCTYCYSTTHGVADCDTKKKADAIPWISKLTRHEEPVAHIRWDDIEKHAPSDELENLTHWLRGQTMLMCDDQTGGVYTWDFDRWVRHGKHSEQGSGWD